MRSIVPSNTQEGPGGHKSDLCRETQRNTTFTAADNSPDLHRHPCPATQLPQQGEHSNSIAATTFFGFFRLGELLVATPGVFDPATWGDVAVDSVLALTMVRFHLRRSKFDQFGRGVDIVVGRMGALLCPVTAIFRFVARCPRGIFFACKKECRHPSPGLSLESAVSCHHWVFCSKTMLAKLALQLQQHWRAWRI